MKAVAVLLVFAVAISLLVFLPRKSVHAALVIRADPSRVWSALMDMQAYGEWNPIFATVEGRFEAGESVRISMRTSDGEFSEIEAEVDEVVPQRLLRQHAGIPGVLMAYHRWELKPHDDGTLVIQHEDYRGIGVLFWSPSYVQDLYEQGLAALRDRLEKG